MKQFFILFFPNWNFPTPNSSFLPACGAVMLRYFYLLANVKTSLIHHSSPPTFLRIKLRLRSEITTINHEIKQDLFIFTWVQRQSASLRLKISRLCFRNINSDYVPGICQKVGMGSYLFKQYREEIINMLSWQEQHLGFLI
jgi:hypothetical protein